MRLGGYGCHACWRQERESWPGHPGTLATREPRRVLDRACQGTGICDEPIQTLPKLSGQAPDDFVAAGDMAARVCAARRWWPGTSSFGTRNPDGQETATASRPPGSGGTARPNHGALSRTIPSMTATARKTDEVPRGPRRHRHRRRPPGRAGHDGRDDAVPRDTYPSRRMAPKNVGDEIRRSARRRLKPALAAACIARPSRSSAAASYWSRCPAMTCG